MIKKGKCQYGCFKAYNVCDWCGKVNKVVAFDYCLKGVGYGDDAKIAEAMKEKMLQDEHKYCIRCGAEL